MVEIMKKRFLNNGLLRRAGEFLFDLESVPVGLGLFASVFVALVAVRTVFTQYEWDEFLALSVGEFFYRFAANLTEFLFLFVVLFLFLTWISGRDRREVLPVLLGGFSLILLPGIAQRWFFGVSPSFYEFASLEQLGRAFLTNFGTTPQIGITPDVRLEIVLAVLGVGFYVFWCCRSWKRVLGGMFGTYLIFFFTASLPSWIVILSEGFRRGFMTITEFDVAASFLAPTSLLSFDLREMAQALIWRMNAFYVVVLSVLSAVFSRQLFGVSFARLFPFSARVFALGSVVFFLFGVQMMLWLSEQSWRGLTLGFFSWWALAALLAAVWWLGTGIYRFVYASSAEKESWPAFCLAGIFSAWLFDWRLGAMFLSVAALHYLLRNRLYRADRLTILTCAVWGMYAATLFGAGMYVAGGQKVIQAPFSLSLYAAWLGIVSVLFWERYQASRNKKDFRFDLFGRGTYSSEIWRLIDGTIIFLTYLFTVEVFNLYETSSAALAAATVSFAGAVWGGNWRGQIIFAAAVFYLALLRLV